MTRSSHGGGCHQNPFLGAGASSGAPGLQGNLAGGGSWREEGQPGCTGALSGGGLPWTVWVGGCGEWGSSGGGQDRSPGRAGAWSSGTELLGWKEAPGATAQGRLVGRGWDAPLRTACPARPFSPSRSSSGGRAFGLPCPPSTAHTTLLDPGQSKACFLPQFLLRSREL